MSPMRPTQNFPTRAVTPPARSAATGAYPGAPKVCATNRYAPRANGSVRVKGVIVRMASDAEPKLICGTFQTNCGTQRSTPSLLYLTFPVVVETEPVRTLARRALGKKASPVRPT